jgi:hypothetical protein
MRYGAAKVLADDGSKLVLIPLFSALMGFMLQHAMTMGW